MTIKPSQKARHVNEGWMKFVELKTKVTTLMVFILSLSLACHLGWSIRLPETALYMSATMLVDLATTAINNYMGYKKEGEELTVRRSSGRAIIIILFTAAVLLGLILAFRMRSFLILAAGFTAFLAGAAYTAGPLPIAATPLGELFSGGIQGYVSMFIFTLIQAPAGRFVTLTLDGGFVLLGAEWAWLGAYLLIGWIPTILIGNVMLANNICDLDKDEAASRYTLPHYLGRNSALTLYEVLYYSAYAVIAVLWLLNIFSPWQLLTFFTLPLVRRNIRTFRQVQVKSRTFQLTLINLAAIMLSLSFTLILSGLLACAM